MTDDAGKLAEAVLADENAPRELKNKARAVLAGRTTVVKTTLPDGNPVHEAAKRGAGVDDRPATTDTAG